MKTIPLPLVILVAGLSGLGCTDKPAEPQGVILAAPPLTAPPNAAAPIEDKPPASDLAGNGPTGEAGGADPLNAAYGKEHPQDPSVHEVPGAGPMNGTLMPTDASRLKTP